MTTCLYFDDQRDDDGGKEFVTRTKPMCKITNGWRRLQIRCKNRSLSSTGSLESKTFNPDQYVMLDDDDDDDHVEGAEANTPTNQFPIVSKQDILFIPQWSKTMVEPQSNTTKDVCIISSSDDELGEGTDSDESFFNTDAATLTHQPTRDEKNGAFPNSSDRQSEAMTTFDPPPMNAESVEDLCGVSFLRPGDNNRRKKYRPRAQKIVAQQKVHVSDSDTEEDSSMSSVPEGGVLNSSNGTSSVEEENCNKNKQRRSIRFSDEVSGQSLATIHLIPWSEHEDPEWIPRPVRCRIEL